MASRLPLYFSLLLLAAVAIMSSAARNAPAKTERNGGMVAMNERFAGPRAEDDSTVHHPLPAGNEGMIGVEDYGDARANHRHDPHHPLAAVKGNNKELDD